MNFTHIIYLSTLMMIYWVSAWKVISHLLKKAAKKCCKKHKHLFYTFVAFVTLYIVYFLNISRIIVWS